MSGKSRDFLTGLAAGTLIPGGVALALIAGVGGTGDTSDLLVAADTAGAAVDWLWRNLGFSIPAFLLLLVLFAASLARLKRAVETGAPPEIVRQADHLSDIRTSLFFGVGVVWTAIGMRGALVQALSDGSAGGVQVLERMVDGGILLALSTTIFGGIGGYLMRVWKALSVGAGLARYYEREHNRDLAALRASVSGIERRLGPPPSRDPG